MKTNNQKAEKIRELTLVYLNEHGLMEITDDDETTCYKTDIEKILDDPEE